MISHCIPIIFFVLLTSFSVKCFAGTIERIEEQQYRCPNNYADCSNRVLVQTLNEIKGTLHWILLFIVLGSTLKGGWFLMNEFIYKPAAGITRKTED